MTTTNTPLSLVLQEDSAGFALGDFWSLTQQAGPLRWPIFLVLAFGLVQVFVKLWELVRDGRVSGGLRSADLASMSLREITDLLRAQNESMLSSLQATMLNVFETRPGEGLLHDEISNFVAFKQAQFEVFRRRMDFLSDTAGALGLMGTVWGMFTVFFQGSAEQDVILRGMGIALITTLLGLVVSIILNFSATELSTFFGRRLEQVSAKADELRFRLMELAPDHVRDPVGATAQSLARPAQVARPPVPPVSEPVSAPAPPAPVVASVAAPAPAARSWHYVEAPEQSGPLRAGTTLERFTLLVRDADGAEAADVPVLVTLTGGDGSVSAGNRTVRAQSDSAGRVTFPCTLPERAGALEFDVALPGQSGPPTRLRFAVEPGPPARVEQQGNHQAAVAGMRLPAPLAVRVLDGFGNPVGAVTVTFRVRAGGGRLASGTDQAAVQTDSQGRADVAFVVSGDVGPNVVSAAVEGMQTAVEFTAYGTGS